MSSIDELIARAEEIRKAQNTKQGNSGSASDDGKSHDGRGDIPWTPKTDNIER